MPEITLLEKRLPYIRMANAKLQSEIAAESHVCEKTIRNLENANANPTLKTFNCIAASFHMSVSAFLKLDLSPALMTDLSPKYEGGSPEILIPEILTLSRWLIVFLSFSGETQQDFSDHTGVGLDTVNRIKRHLPSCNPTLSTLQNFAAYMSITVSELLDTTLSEDDMRKMLEESIRS